jgi:hypothetical protein
VSAGPLSKIGMKRIVFSGEPVGTCYTNLG